MGLCKECSARQIGACRDLNYCRDERAALIEAARGMAQRLGHELTDFVRSREGSSAFEASCTRCRMSAIIDPNPAIGERDICGDAVSLVCPASTADARTSQPPNNVGGE